MDEQKRQAEERNSVRKKLPEWTSLDSIAYPRHISLEQCSSQATAEYKASIVEDVTKGAFVDLTGGFGVDCYYIGKHFDKAVYVEQNAELCETAKHNFSELGFNCDVCCEDASAFLAAMSPVHLIYIDPARRDTNGRRTYDIADCTPNVKELNDLLLAKADKVLVKLSPMFDWHKAVSDCKGVTEVHIVSVNNECKELLLVMEKQQKVLRVFCVNNQDVVEFSSIPSEDVSVEPIPLEVCKYLYEPNASVMKSGCFREVKAMYGIDEVSSNSHLFVSDKDIENFPGRKFQISSISSFNKKELKEKLAGITKANITVHNFPAKVSEVRKKLKLADGGDVYIFATTTRDQKHVMFICNKIPY